MEKNKQLTLWQRWFPNVSVGFFSYRDHLVPIERDIIRSTGKSTQWGIVFSPGRVWSEPTDKGWSRGSFPFVLTGPNYNESHNGIATFVYNDTRISRVRFQIVQEASPWNRFLAWGELEPTMTRIKKSDRELLETRFDEELAARLPILSLADLEQAGTDSQDVVANWPGGQHVSVSGVVVDGRIYRSECKTPMGDFPYCDAMRHGVFSVTKSMGAMLSYLWLAQKYGEEIADYKIVDYLDVTADHSGWEEVTFADALNMVTGVGDLSHDRNSPVNDEDDGSLFTRFSENKRSVKRKLEVVFSGHNYPWGAGEVFRYRTVDTFVLAAAMDSLLKRHEGAQANLWDQLSEEVLRPIGIKVLPILHTVEPDGSRGVPILGAGLYVSIDDVAKITGLLQRGGRHKGRQLLNPTLLDEALTQGLNKGKPTAWKEEGEELRYYLSLWNLSVELGDCVISAPHMVGYGGNLVQLLPHGVTSFYFEDGKSWQLTELARAAHRARWLCVQ